MAATMRYLGCAPVTDIGEDVTQGAVDLLVLKLARLQKKLIDKAVEQKHGSRLSEASPVYKKIAEKLARAGKDCTHGDPVNFSVETEYIVMSEPEKDSRTNIPLGDVLSLTLLPPKSVADMVYFSFICEEAQNRLQCHVLIAPPEVAEKNRVSMSQAIRNFAKSPKAAKMKGGVLGRAGGMDTKVNKPGTITFGVGLQRKKSSIRMSQGLQRKGTVNLKGKSGGEVKRRSSTYGNTFASFAAPAPANLPAVADEPDDLLDGFDGFDDDIFGQDDVINEGDAVDDDLDLDLDQFGFDDGDADDDGC